MRKILISVLIVLLGILSYVSFTKGVNIFNIQINSYNKIKDTYQKLDDVISEINTKSTEEFENKKETLDTSYKSLKELEQTYKEKVQAMLLADRSIELNVYDIDYLWARIGTHATDRNVKMKLDISENSNGTTAVGNYCLCDFYFTVVGEYMDIMLFIYDLEDDDQLELSIENFKLTPSSGSLTATFKVSEMPINKENLTGISNSSSNTNQPTSESTNTTANTNTSSSTNTTNSTKTTNSNTTNQNTNTTK